MCNPSLVISSLQLSAAPSVDPMTHVDQSQERLVTGYNRETGRTPHADKLDTNARTTLAD